jgi:N-acetyl sugar amidotransferase
MTKGYQICSRCIMDTTVPDIIFNEQGVCNLCIQYEQRTKKELHYDEVGQASLQDLINKIKAKGSRREYDCLIGISGGVDSTYVAYLVKKKFGLRPLAVHLDNGWDTELAVSNVEQTMKRLEIDLFTYVLNWEEFKDLQISFLKSSISNAEIPTDHAIWAILIRIAATKGIQYIISGSNIVTECLMPESWLYGSKDARIINSIQNQYGTAKLKTFPQLSTLDFIYYLMIKGIRWVPVLNHVPYNKKEAKRTLCEELNWRDYGGKHYESVYTRFFHAYYLPKKFNIDLRRAYTSALIMSGQIARDQALQEIQELPYPSDLMEEDKEFVIKKLGLSQGEFDQIMTAPPKPYSDYANIDKLWRRFSGIVNFARNRVIGEN